MRIHSVEAYLLSYPFPAPLELPYHGGHRRIVKRDAMLIRVEGDHGLYGWAPGQGSEAARAAIADEVAPWLAGRRLADPDALRAAFVESRGGDPALLNAYSAVEIALYDLLGKMHGLPVAELVGGRIRDSIALYGSAGMYMTPEGYAREAEAIAGLGFPAYKMRPALGPGEDLRTVALMRQAVGTGVELMIDAHSWWRMGDKSYPESEVTRLAEAMSEHGIAWLEEPLPPDDHDAYQRLHEMNIVPLASGEHERNEAGFLDLIYRPAVDYVQMDIVCQGGFAMGRRLFGEVQRAGLRFAFHSWGTDLEVLAAAHLGVCWPDNVVEWLEYPVYTTAGVRSMYEWPTAREVLRDPLDIQDGRLRVPSAPGLGMDVDPAVIDRYPWIPGPWSYFTLESPRQTFAVIGDHSVKFA